MLRLQPFTNPETLQEFAAKLRCPPGKRQKIVAIHAVVKNDDGGATATFSLRLQYAEGAVQFDVHFVTIPANGEADVLWSREGMPMPSSTRVIAAVSAPLWLALPQLSTGRDIDIRVNKSGASADWSIEDVWMAVDEYGAGE